MPLATWLVTLYPRAWRRRYEEEMLALLEQHRVTLLTVLDLLFGMISARLNPAYRDDPGPVMLTSLPKATWLALAAWGAFVLCVAVTSGPIYLGMVFFLTGQRTVPWFTGSSSIIWDPGTFEPMAMSPVVGGNLWLSEPALVLLPFFAITALVSLGCLRWAVRTHRIWIIVLTTVWFAVPVAVILWLVIPSHDMPRYLSPFQTPFGPGLVTASRDRPIFLFLSQVISSLPVSLLTTLGELEALMAIVFLSGLKAGKALRTRRYRLLGLVAGVDLVLILITVYFVKVWDLFTPFGPPDFVGAPLTQQQVQTFFTTEALGLCAHLLPFAAVALPLLALGGSAVGRQQWHAVVAGVSLLAVLMAVCDMCFLVTILISGGEGLLSGIPLIWAQEANHTWYIVLLIPEEVIVATLVLSLLLAFRALRSMVVAGMTADPAVRAPA
jgi:hypothetical protein